MSDLTRWLLVALLGSLLTCVGVVAARWHARERHPDDLYGPRMRDARILAELDFDADTIYANAMRRMPTPTRKQLTQ